MPIKQVFDTPETVPEFLKSAVVEQDGKWVFEAETATETAGLKSALQREREAKSTLEKSLKGFEGLDPEKARKALEELQRAENEKLKAKGDWETREANLKTQLEEQFKKQYNPIEAENQKLKAAVEKHLKVATAMQALASRSDTPELVLPHILNHIAVVEENGEYVARVMQGGQVRIGNAKGEPMTIEQLIETDFLSNKMFAPAFKAATNGGGGAGPNTSGGHGNKSINRAAFDKMAPSDQMAHIKAGGAITD